MQTIFFNETNDVNIPLSPIFFGNYLSTKSSFFIIFSFYYGLKKTTDYEFMIYKKEIAKYFNVSMKNDSVKKSLYEIQRISYFLGFSVDYDYYSNAIIFNILNKNKILQFYTDYNVVNIYMICNASKLNVYAIKLYLYTETIPSSVISITELKKLFGVQNSEYYDDFSKFNSKILKPSLQKVNEIVDLNYQYNKNNHKQVESVLIQRDDMLTKRGIYFNYE